MLRRLTALALVIAALLAISASAQASKNQAQRHWAGWSCITNGAYPGAPHEGNGYNGSYTGPLGMSTPWAGHYPPGKDWVHSNRAAVYAIAEQVAARYHWSYTWMQHQWPNTFPPCARYFRT